MQATKAAPQQEGPYTPDQIPPIVFETFSGLNTNSTRPGIKDDECWWLDGFMPVGPNYARTMPGIGSAIFTAGIGQAVDFFDFFNIGATPYSVIILSDGSISVTNTNTSVSTQIAPAGTILNPSRENVGITQWGSQYLIIVANQTNGYFMWDGSNFYTTGTLGPSVNITNGGSGYTSPPSITAYGGSGSGASFSAIIQNGIVTNISVTNPGIGYQVDDVVGLAFSGGGITAATAILMPVLSAGTIASVSVINPGLGYGTSLVLLVEGGGGNGALLTATVVATSVSSVTVSDAGQNYSSLPTIIIQDSENAVAQADVPIMPFGVQGSSVETYTSHVWISSFMNNIATITFSAPGSPTDFSTIDGGGSFPSTDSFLRVQYTQLKQSNGFLYLIADSSVNYISGVQTSESPAETTFTNQNADPEIGTPYAATVDVFSRNILFANAFGVHVSFGGAVTKISDNLDGIYNTVPNFGGFTLSAAKSIVFGKRIWVVLIPVIDFITGQQVNKLFCMTQSGQKTIWWSTQQDVNLIYIQHQEIASVLTAYGTDGNSIFPLFQRPSVAFTKTIQSKLWAQPGGYLNMHTADRLWGLVQYFSNLSPQLTITIDNEKGIGTGAAEEEYDLGPSVMNWTTANGSAMNWKTASGAAMIWTTSGVGIVVIPPQAIGQTGVLLGMTISTQAADLALISFAIAPQIAGYRG